MDVQPLTIYVDNILAPSSIAHLTKVSISRGDGSSIALTALRDKYQED
jgi:hypothetical protein